MMEAFEAGVRLSIFIIGSAVLAVLLATAYTAGVAAGKAAAHVDDEESKIYMPHTHGGDPDT